jgi:hypothetical protein
VSANFYDNSGIMAGMEMHKYWMAGPPPPTGTPVPLHPHASACPFSQKAAKWYLRTTTITSDAQLMIAGGFDDGPVLHLPYPLPPGPAEALQYTIVFANSTSTAQLTVGSVTGEGNELACCIYGFYGLNINCSDPIDGPLGHVICVNSVKTSPTLGDFISAILNWLVGAGINYKIGKLLDWLKDAKKAITDKGIAVVKGILRWLQDTFKTAYPTFAPIFEPFTTLIKKLKPIFDWAQEKSMTPAEAE